MPPSRTPRSLLVQPILWATSLCIAAGVGTLTAPAAAQSADPAAAAAQPASPALTQSPLSDASPQFEVATIKPSDPASCCARTWRREGRRLSTQNTYLRWLIQWAYGLQPKQITGEPEWVDKDRFDISGVIEGTESPTDPEWKAAIQKLLADRFQLHFHHETREMSAYALVVAKGGPKLTRSDPANDQHSTIGFSGGVGEIMQGHGTDVTLAQLLAELQRLVLDRPAIDRTGLTGTFNISLDFTRENENSLGMTQLPDTAAPNLLTALDQQLGLKLEGTKAPVDVLVIDSAVKPSTD